MSTSVGLTEAQAHLHIGVPATQNSVIYLRALCGDESAEFVIASKYAMLLVDEDLCPACRIEMHRPNTAGH